MTERLWNLRGPRPSDLPWIVSTWINSYRREATRRGVDVDCYNAAQRRTIEGLLPNTLVVVACDPADPEQTFGWACVKEDVVHYVFVKDAFRRSGIATDMLTFLLPDWRQRERYCSHRPRNFGEETKDFAGELLQRWKLRWNPWLATGETHR